MTKLTGSCLCGSVKYEIEGSPQRFYHCHCQRCRKLTGTGHASNLFVETPAIQWLQGEDLLRTYKVPEAERFHNRFCSNCGSPMPRYIPQRGFAVVPAGSLDSELDLKPQSRIFVGSAASWSCRDKDLPEFHEYPEV